MDAADFDPDLAKLQDVVRRTLAKHSSTPPVKSARIRKPGGKQC